MNAGIAYGYVNGENVTACLRGSSDATLRQVLADALMSESEMLGLAHALRKSCGFKYRSVLLSLVKSVKAQKRAISNAELSVMVNADADTISVVHANCYAATKDDLAHTTGSLIQAPELDNMTREDLNRLMKDIRENRADFLRTPSGATYALNRSLRTASTTDDGLSAKEFDSLMSARPAPRESSIVPNHTRRKILQSVCDAGVLGVDKLSAVV